MLRRLGDRGEGSLSYLTVILLVAAVTAVVSVVALGDEISAGIRSGVCAVSQDEDCREPGGDPGASPSAGASGTSPAAVPAGEETPEEREYREALAASNKADQDAQGVENEWNDFSLLKEIGKLGLDFIAGDIIKCVENPNFLDCLWAIVGIVPWGKIGKLIKSIPKIAKLIDRFLDLKRRLDKARKARKDAKDRLDRALDACKKKKDPNSFLPGTPVLMGDGTRRPIERVRVGDTVWASDPETGRSGPRRVTRLITGTGVKQLVDLTIDPDGAVGGRTATVTATTGHPFWVAGADDWIDAGRLVFGDILTAPDGRRAMVVDRHRHHRTQAVYNLTVDDLHTFYVTAGERDLLVHNTPTPGPGDACDIGGPTPTPTPKPTSRVPDDSHLPPASTLIQNGQQFNGRRLPQRNGPPNGTLYKKDPQTGQVTNYTVYDANGNPIKRVDITGRPHGGVPTPHVVYYEHNVNPKTGQIFPEEQRTVRQARPDEIP